MSANWNCSYTLDTSYVKKIQRQWKRERGNIYTILAYLRMQVSKAETSEITESLKYDIANTRAEFLSYNRYYSRHYPEKDYRENQPIIFNYAPEDMEILKEISKEMAGINKEADILYQKFRILCYDQNISTPIIDYY